MLHVTQFIGHAARLLFYLNIAEINITRREENFGHDWGSLCTSELSRIGRSDHHLKAYYAAASSSKHTVTVWRPSVCPVFFLTLIERAAHAHRDHWRRQLWGTGARATSIYNNFFQCGLTYTKSDSDYMWTVASYKHPVTTELCHLVL